MIVVPLPFKPVQTRLTQAQVVHKPEIRAFTPSYVPWQGAAIASAEAEPEIAKHDRKLPAIGNRQTQKGTNGKDVFLLFFAPPQAAAQVQSTATKDLLYGSRANRS